MEQECSLCCFAGTVTNVREAVAWLGYTYLFVRMKKNPLAYGIPWDELAIEPDLLDRRRTLITNAARELERSKMARYLVHLIHSAENTPRCCSRIDIQKI